MPIVEKIRTIAQRVYGADDIELSPEARAKIDYYNQQVTSLLLQQLTHTLTGLMQLIYLLFVSPFLTHIHSR